VEVSISPERSNICYTIGSNISLKDLSSEVHQQFTKKMRFLFDHGLRLLNTMLFVRKFSDCADWYSILKGKLSITFSSPADYPDVAQYRNIHECP